MIRRILLAASLVAATAAWGQLSESEQRLVAAVKARSPEALQLLERTVRVNSGTLNTEGVREVGRILRAELDALGFETRWAEMPPEMKRGGHLVATRKGTRGKRVLLIGHLDTVFELDSGVAPWNPSGDRVRGQGVSDMKGGNVVMLEALRALKATGALEGATISVIFTGDEERVGIPQEVSRADMVALARSSDLALAFEAAARSREGGHMASYARRSAGGWELKVTGRPGHSGGVFSETSGYGAIFEAVRIVDEFRRELQEPNLTFNPGVIVGGTTAKYDHESASGAAFGKTNVIAREATVRGDLRYLTPEQGERVRARMREIVAKSLPQTQASITFTESYPPQAPTEAGARLLDTLSKASEDAGLGPIRAMDPARRGAGDVQFVAPYIPALDGLGASGAGAHTDFEEMELASIERGAIRAAILIYRLTR
jgi:glutamate carboxypeptidase